MRRPRRYPAIRRYPKVGDIAVHSTANVIQYIKKWYGLNGPYKPSTYIVNGQEVIV
jgi:hypothetical protein